MPITVFYSSVSASREIRTNQQKIENVLSSRKIDYELVYICQDPKAKELMRQLAGDPGALPPQICNGNVYCGDYTAFENAIEEENLEKFLKL